MNEYLKNYLIAVEHPGPSGFEHLEMLLVRDKLAEQETALTPNQKAQLIAADRRLLAQADAFYAELSRITDLEIERQRRQPPSHHWWWYLDVLVKLPGPPRHTSSMAPT
jgi:hypothetical protein